VKWRILFLPLSVPMNPDSTIEPSNRGDFHSGELLLPPKQVWGWRPFLKNRMFYSLQKYALRSAFHQL